MPKPVLTQLVLVLLFCGADAAGSAPPGGVASARTLLLVDDHHVLYRSGTRRVLHPPTRHPGNPVISETKPWEVAIAWTSVHRSLETGLYQLWYQAWAGPDSRTPQCATCYAESKDGIHFTKPDLGLYPFNNIQKTNIVMIGNGGHSVRYGNSVVVDPREPDATKRYKMAYFDFGMDNGKEYPGLHVAFSPDGIHWTKPDLPMPLQRVSYGSHGDAVPFQGEGGRDWAVPLSMSDALDVFYDTKRDVFAIYGKMWLDGPGGAMYWKHAMGRIESKDFLHWSQPELILAPDDLDPPYVEFHTSPVFLHADCYFSLIQILNRAEGGGVLDIELAVSRDGFDWHRPFRKEFFLARTGGERFDGGSIFTNATPIILDDEIRFYYGAYSQGATGADDRKQVSGVGLATSPRDRFAGLRPVLVSKLPTRSGPLHNMGQVTLRPLDLSGCDAITLNADASSGSIRVEVLDTKGYRIQGYTRDDAVPITGDSLRHSVRWNDHAIADLAKAPHLLRFHLDNAEVFAVSLMNLEA